MSVLLRLRAFLHTCIHAASLRNLLPLLRNAFLFLSQLARRAVERANMASPVDSKAPSHHDEHGKRRMVHLKTKEECRLGNDTIQVWTVEMPSKHAEGILKYLHHPLIPVYHHH